jgi:hypothetical protein
MAQFPRTEPEIAVLVESMLSGLANHVDIYPAPPVVLATLSNLRDAYTEARQNALQATALAQQATVTKDTALDALIAAMKTDIRYAENTVAFDDEKLRFIGWSGRKVASATEPPGQARLLEAPRQGEGWVFLDWKAPTEGGKPTAYRVQRRERPSGPWTDVATAIDSEANLIDQPRAKEFEFRVLAINKAGEGEASNTVVVVL